MQLQTLIVLSLSVCVLSVPWYQDAFSEENYASDDVTAEADFPANKEDLSSEELMVQFFNSPGDPGTEEPEEEEDSENGVEQDIWNDDQDAVMENFENELDTWDDDQDDPMEDDVEQESWEEDHDDYFDMMEDDVEQESWEDGHDVYLAMEDDVEQEPWEDDHDDYLDMMDDDVEMEEEMPEASFQLSRADLEARLEKARKQRAVIQKRIDDLKRKIKDLKPCPKETCVGCTDGTYCARKIRNKCLLTLPKWKPCCRKVPTPRCIASQSAVRVVTTSGIAVLRGVLRTYDSAIAAIKTRLAGTPKYMENEVENVDMSEAVSQFDMSWPSDDIDQQPEGEEMWDGLDEYADSMGIRRRAEMAKERAILRVKIAATKAALKILMNKIAVMEEKLRKPIDLSACEGDVCKICFKRPDCASRWCLFKFPRPYKCCKKGIQPLCKVGKTALRAALEAALKGAKNSEEKLMNVIKELEEDLAKLNKKNP